MVYKTKGTCSSEIEFEVENGILTDIHFVSVFFSSCFLAHPANDSTPKTLIITMHINFFSFIYFILLGQYFLTYSL